MVSSTTLSVIAALAWPGLVVAADASTFRHSFHPSRPTVHDFLGAATDADAVRA